MKENTDSKGLVLVSDVIPDAVKEKQRLRLLAQEKIIQMSEENRNAVDRKIIRRLLARPEYRSADTVFCFVGTEYEINTKPVLEQTLKDGKNLAVPRCSENGQMDARLIHSLSELHPGRFGILEPPASAPLAAAIGLSVIPCLSATPEGDRLGHGGGYYDRFLARFPKIPAVLLCREALLVEHLPTEKFDQRISVVITENRVYP